ncbi:hypothetical protein M8J77_025507 [Diaphorina citri]|nr:hypothetical protein M8J77_025507 [Diaphorina citri]
MSSTLKLPKFEFLNYTRKEIEEFKRRFSLFIQANELSEKSQLVKVALLRSAFDEKINDLIDALNLENVTVDNVFKGLESELIKTDDVSYEQYRFFNRVQKEGESFNEFYVELRNIAQYCKFGEQLEPLLKARIVFGISNKMLQERLMRSPELKLSEVINCCRSSESAKARVEEINQPSEPESSQVCSTNTAVHRVAQHRNFTNSRLMSFRKSHRTTRQPGSRDEPRSRNECSRCLGGHSTQVQCPAQGQQCYICGKHNHFSVACLSRYPRNVQRYVSRPHQGRSSEQYSRNSRRHNYKVKSLQINHSDDSDSSNASAEVGLVASIESRKQDQWNQTFKFNDNCEVKFKLDTGSDISIVTTAVLKEVKPKLLNKIKPCSLKAEAFGGHELKFLGTVELKLKIKESTHNIKFYVMPDYKGVVPILGKGACEKLGLVKRIYSVSNSSKEEIVNSYRSAFEGIGKFPTEYEIRMEKGESPTIKPPRRVAYTLLPKLEKTLNKLVEQKIIQKVDHPKEWCSNLVLVEKPNGDLRICLDPIDLNKQIKSEHFLIPTLDEIKSKLSGKRFFSVLDLKDGFYQVPLAKGSDDFCTFSTPIGYFKFLRVPFGLKTSPEIFMKINSESFKNIPNVIIYFDDFLIATEDEQTHLETLKLLFNRAIELNVKFNENKFQFMTTKIKYLGHVFSEQGCQLDDDRVEAIKALKEPTNVKELRSMLGMVNFVRDFVPNMSDLTAPLRLLLKKNIAWHWSVQQQSAFDKLKVLLCNSPVLKNFDCNLDVTIQTDASKDGMGCVLLQQNHPVAFASRSLTEAEKKLAQIEKETLAIAFSCRKFHKYIWGKTVKVESDHLPLVSIFRKNLSDIASERIVKIRLNLMRYNLDVNYLPGKKMFIADLLSRNFQNEVYNDEINIQGYIHNIYAEEKVLDFKTISDEISLDNDLSIIVKHAQTVDRGPCPPYSLQCTVQLYRVTDKDNSP